jgi:hypothetical protein
VIGKSSICGQGMIPQGRDYEKLRTANLASNCKMIDDYVYNAGTITSMKTLDLSASSYQSMNAIDSRVRLLIDDLSNFTELHWTDNIKGIHYDLKRGKNFQDRYLEIGIPAEKATRVQVKKLIDLQEYAQSKDITLIIVEVP